MTDRILTPQAVNWIEASILRELNRRSAAGMATVQPSPEERLRLRSGAALNGWQALLTLPVRPSALVRPTISQIQAVALRQLGDASHWNIIDDYVATFDWGLLALIIKATEGLTWKDPAAEGHFAGATLAGMGRAFYHFARPAWNQVSQARWFVQRVREITGNQIPIIGYYRGQPVAGMALDFEVTEDLSPERLNSWVWGFVSETADLIGAFPLLYTSPYIWSLVGGDKSRFIAVPLWDAHWGVSSPYIPYPWSEIVVGPDEVQYHVWQTGILAKGTVPGVSSALDHNLTPMTITVSNPTDPPPDPDPVPEPTGLVARVLAPGGWVNLRSGPGTQYADISDLHAGDEVQVLGFDAPREGWIKVKAPDGQVGWAAYKYNGTPLIQSPGEAAVNYSLLEVVEWPKG